MTISRSRRAVIKRAATQIRVRCLGFGHDVEQTADVIRAELPEVQPLEAWRFALGWPRSRTIERVGALYRSRGLLPPGLSESMLCRWEHRPYEKPGPEYVEALCAVYRAVPRQLGLDRGAAHEAAGWEQPTRYSASGPTTSGLSARESVVLMTTSAGLPAVRESLHLAVLADPVGSSTVADLAEAAIEHYALGYSKHPPHVLFGEVHAVRGLLTQVLTSQPVSQPVRIDLQRSLGWLSALLGNLAHHVGDPTGARVHFGTAVAYGERAGDRRLTAWVWGAQAMVARAGGKHTLALEYAERGLASAPSGLSRAQLRAWAQLPSLAAMGREREADAALANARRELEADAKGWAPGRFGYDVAEHTLHEADAQRSLGRADRAAESAGQSLHATVPGTPGWAAASLSLAQAEASAHPSDAAHRAAEVLDRVPAGRLRATSRDRLAQLASALAGTRAQGVEDLIERLRVLPPLIDTSGSAASA